MENPLQFRHFPFFTLRVYNEGWPSDGYLHTKSELSSFNRFWDLAP